MKAILIIGLFFSNFFLANAQWSKCNLPDGILPFSLAIQVDTIYLGTVGSGLYRSTNEGTDWTEINSGVTSKQIWSIYKTANTIFASSLNGNLYRSTNGGDNWENANNGISSTTIIREFANYKGKLFATSTNKGVYMSTDNGTTWATHNSGIVGLVAKALEIANGELYVGVLQSVYKYDDTDQKWVRKSNGKSNQTVSSLKYMKDSTPNGKLFASHGDVKNVDKTDDKGENWLTVSNGLPNVGIYSLQSVGANLFAGNDYGVYQTTDFGNNWIDVSTGFPRASQANFITPGSTNLYVLQGGALWKRNLSEFGITGIKKNDIEQDLKILYHQSSNQIELKLSEQIAKIEIYNLAGNLILQSLSDNNIVNIQDLEKGIYLLKVKGISTFNVGKIIKK